MKEKFDLVWENVFSLLAQIGGTCHLENAGATGIWERNVPPFLPCLDEIKADNRTTESWKGIKKSGHAPSALDEMYREYRFRMEIEP